MKHSIIYILLALSASLILLNRYTALYINNAIVHYILLFTASATLLITVGHFFGKLKSSRSIVFTFITVAILCFLKSYFTWGGDWKTQTVLYTDKTNNNRTIEYQMQANRFAFGYRDRIVNRLKIVPTIDWIKDIDTAAIDSSNWTRVEKNVNEMKLN